MKSIFLLLILVIAATLPAQNRTDYAVFFVASKFDHGWQPLSDAPGEVAAIAAQLETNYGFQVKIVPNATRADIIKTLGEYKTKPYGPKDQVLLFFSMHGVHDKGSDKGYLIPKNGLLNDPTYDSWFSHSQLAEITQSMPCNRVLVALDACYSGIFGKHRDDNRPTPAWERPEYLCQERLIKAFNSNKTRKYLTAGGDVRVPAKSVYAAQWVAALQAGGGSDGLLGFHELLGYVDQFQEPRPAWGDFVPGTSGDFVFVKKDGCATPSAPGLEAETPEKRLFRDVAEWQKADALKTLDAYRDYYDHWCPGGTFCETADAKMKAMQNSAIPDNMLRIPGGTFMMGSTDEDYEKPVHEVTVSDFYLSKYELTVADFQTFIEASGYQTDAEKNGEGVYFYNSSTSELELMPGIDWRYDAAGNLRPESEYNHPVIHVSWNDAMAYCDWLSEKTGKTYRLPTEAEWEYAAGNGSRHTKYSWGNGEPAEKKGGNVADETVVNQFNWEKSAIYIFLNYNDGYALTAPVGAFDANDFGLFDMTGNVQEWCSDWTWNYSSGKQTNPSGPSTGAYRVYRGGGWNCDPLRCRVTSRDHYNPTYRFNYLGFRLARSF